MMLQAAVEKMTGKDLVMVEENAAIRSVCVTNLRLWPRIF